MYCFTTLVTFLVLPFILVISFIVSASLVASASPPISFIDIYLCRQRSFGCRHFWCRYLAVFLQKMQGLRTGLGVQFIFEVKSFCRSTFNFLCCFQLCLNSAQKRQRSSESICTSACCSSVHKSKSNECDSCATYSRSASCCRFTPMYSEKSTFVLKRS